MASKQSFEDSAAATFGHDDMDAAAAYRSASVGSLGMSAGSFGMSAGSFGMSAGSFGMSAGSFGTDDLYSSAGRFLPDSVSTTPTFSLDETPVYRDLQVFRNKTIPSALKPCAAPFTKPQRSQSSVSEPLRNSKMTLPPPVPEMFVLEKSHLLLKDVSLERALDKVMRCLNKITKIDPSIQCDCEVVRKDFKIRGMVHSGYDNVDFRVCIFRSRSDGRIALPLVEFQRRSGDLFLFHRFFSTISAALTGTKQQTFGLGCVPPVMMDLGDDECDMEDEIKPLANLLDSEYMDMQLEGVRALGQIIGQTTDIEFTTALPKLIKSILKLAASSDRELHCLVVSLIATMCTKLQQQNTKDAEKLMAEFVIPIVRALKNVQRSYTTAHTQRECVRAISAASHRMSCGKQIVAAGGVEALHQCIWQADDMTKSFAQTALRNLVACR